MARLWEDSDDRLDFSPEVVQQTMAGLSMAHAVARALEAGILFHIDLVPRGRRRSSSHCSRSIPMLSPRAGSSGSAWTGS